MRFKYITGAILTEFYRLLRVFPNSDPIMGFILPAAKNEPYWKAPLFAFATMFIFDFFTSGIGAWTFVTSAMYALIAIAAGLYFRNRKAGIFPYTKAAIGGVLAFDFVTGPLMSAVLFRQDFLLTLLMQIPFTAMHLVSGIFAIVLITPFFDAQCAKEIGSFIRALKSSVYSRWLLP